MNRKDLYEGVGHIDDRVLERSQKNKRRRYRRPWWFAATAALLVLVIGAGILFYPTGNPLVTNAYAIAEASYPQMAPYPTSDDGDIYNEEHEAWWQSIEAQQRPEGYADGLEPFFTASIQQFLSGEEGENRVYSPLNVYMALGMLAELTDGNSRQQILDLLGAESIEALRTQANDVWNAQYRDDGQTISVLASSLWLNEDISFQPATLKRLADTYYASSYQGEMGSEGLNEAFRDWINQQTGGLLEKQIGDLSLDPQTIMALASTLYFQGKWGVKFLEQNTYAEDFHAVSGDITCDFMHESTLGNYYWGDQFTAVGKWLQDSGGTVWFLLPDEGVAVEELLEDQQVMDFLMANGEWENRQYLIVNLSLPKFDITSQLDLTQGLQELGVTDVFREDVSDFSPMTTEAENVFVSQAQQHVRVTVDEEGVTAAAAVVFEIGGGASPTDEVDFVLDRPFLFAVTSADGLPLFVGIVHQPV